MTKGKHLVCQGDRVRFTCTLDNSTLPSLPPENIVFDETTINNLKKIVSEKKGKNYYISIYADDQSEIECYEDMGDYGLMIKCKAIGSRTPDFPSAWEIVGNLPEIYEPEGEDAEKLNEIFNKVLENNFPYIKEKISYLKPFASNALSDQALTMSWEYEYDEKTGEYKILPMFIAFGTANIKGLANDKLKQENIELDMIHELTHVSREFEGRYSRNIGTEEGETYLEAMIRGDLKIRLKYPLPHGEVESIIYVTHCALPKQYCFKNLKTVREFEEFNYELVTGETKPKPITPESPEWEEIEKRLPVAPIVDMMRAMYGEYNPVSDVSEYWVVTISPTGNRYLYLLSDLTVDNEDTDIVEAIKDIDEITPLTKTDVVKVWDFP